MKKKKPSSYWNTRVIKYLDGTYGVHEVYYRRGERLSYTAGVLVAAGSSKTELRGSLQKLFDALLRPTLSEKRLSAPSKKKKS